MQDLRAPKRRQPRRACATPGRPATPKPERPRAKARRHRALLRHPRSRRRFARAGGRARHHRVAQIAEGNGLSAGRLVRQPRLSVARAGPQAPDRRSQADQSRLRRLVILDAQRRAARRAPAPGAARSTRPAISARCSTAKWSISTAWRPSIGRCGCITPAARACRCIAARSASCSWRWRAARAGGGCCKASSCAASPSHHHRPTRLETELRQIRKEQVSFDRQEYLVGVVCMAVPVVGQERRDCSPRSPSRRRKRA